MRKDESFMKIISFRNIVFLIFCGFVFQENMVAEYDRRSDPNLKKDEKIEKKEEQTWWEWVKEHKLGLGVGAFFLLAKVGNDKGWWDKKGLNGNGNGGNGLGVNSQNINQSNNQFQQQQQQLTNSVQFQKQQNLLYGTGEELKRPFTFQDAQEKFGLNFSKRDAEVKKIAEGFKLLVLRDEAQRSHYNEKTIEKLDELDIKYHFTEKFLEYFGESEKDNIVLGKVIKKLFEGWFYKWQNKSNKNRTMSIITIVKTLNSNLSGDKDVVENLIDNFSFHGFLSEYIEQIKDDWIFPQFDDKYMHEKVKKLFNLRVNLKNLISDYNKYRQGNGVQDDKKPLIDNYYIVEKVRKKLKNDL